MGEELAALVTILEAGCASAVGFVRGTASGRTLVGRGEAGALAAAEPLGIALGCWAVAAGAGGMTFDGTGSGRAVPEIAFVPRHAI